jgi:hypothetical protein
MSLTSFALDAVAGGNEVGGHDGGDRIVHQPSLSA